MTTTIPARTDRAAARRTSGATVLLLATLTVGLVAGTYYAFGCAVIPGLSRTGDRTYIEAMRQINEAIENPVFFASFFGAAILAPIAAVQQWRRGRRRAAQWALAGFVLYLVGFLATMVGDIPLNDQLAAAGNPAHIADPGTVLAGFETPWLAWNMVRTVATTAALACLGRALVLHGRQR